MTEKGADVNSIEVGEWGGGYTMNPGVGDGDRLCNAGPHNSAVSPRAGIHRSERNRRIRPDPFISFYSPHPSPTPPNSNYGCLWGPHSDYFYYNCTSCSFCLLEFRPRFYFLLISISLYHPDKKWTLMLKLSKQMDFWALQHSVLFLLQESSARWSFLASFLTNYIPTHPSLACIYNWCQLILWKLLSGHHICGTCTLRVIRVGKPDVY